MRTRARVALYKGVELCRLDVAKSSKPIWACTSRKQENFYVRMNNSSRLMPSDEIDAYISDRWDSRSRSEV